MIYKLMHLISSLKELNTLDGKEVELKEEVTGRFTDEDALALNYQIQVTKEDKDL